MSAAVKPPAVFAAATTRVFAGVNSGGTSSGLAARAFASWQRATIDSRPSLPAGVGAAAAVVDGRTIVAVSELPHPATAAATRPSAAAEPTPRGIERYEETGVVSGAPVSPAAARRVAALSVRSHVKSWSSRPKWPYAAVFW